MRALDHGVAPRARACASLPRPGAHHTYPDTRAFTEAVMRHAGQAMRIVRASHPTIPVGKLGDLRLNAIFPVRRASSPTTFAPPGAAARATTPSRPPLALLSYKSEIVCFPKIASILPEDAKQPMRSEYVFCPTAPRSRCC